MSDFTVTIVGTGVIGTSLGLAMKQQDGLVQRLLAHDKELSVAKEAVKLGAFDKAEWNLVNACEPADLIILAVPLNGVRPTLEAIAPYLKPDVVITDTCPSKQVVLRWAQELLPDNAYFIGGNPIVRPAGSGLDYARADLFRDALYCLTPSPAAHEEAVQLLAGLASAIGAEPFFLDPAEHDGLLTAVEHLPRLLSIAMIRILAEQGAWREMRKMAGSTFEQVSAGASGDPDALKDNFLENQQILTHQLDQVIAELQAIRRQIAGLEAQPDTAEQLAQQIDQAVVARLNWLNDYQQGHFADPERQPAQQVELPGFFERWIGFGAFRKKQDRNK